MGVVVGLPCVNDKRLFKKKIQIAEGCWHVMMSQGM
jgi:hypothetical protein